MKIPIIQAETNLPSTTYPIERSVLRDVAAVGGQFQNLIDNVAAEQGKVLEKQRLINQATEISQAEIDVENANQENIKKLRQNPNPQTYYPEWEASFRKSYKERLAQIADPETKAKAELVFQKMLFQNMVEENHYGNMLWVSTKRGQIARLSDQYIKNGQPEKAIKLVEDGIVGGLFKPEEGEKEIIDIKDKSDRLTQEANFGQAMNMVMVNPTEEALERAIELFKIPADKQPILRKQQRIERDAQERQKAELLRLAGDKEDNEIATLYLDKKYSEVYKRVQNPESPLTSERRTFWGDHVERAAKQKEEVDPDIEVIKYAFINDLIANEVPKEIVRDYIVTDDYLSKATKEKLLDRNLTNTNKEVNKASQRSYEYMKREIMSPSGIAGVIAKSVPEDVRAKNYSKAQVALDDWIDQQRRIPGKVITGKDVLSKAEELVKTFAPKINQNAPIIQKKTEDFTRGLKELGQMAEGKGVETAPIQAKPKQTKYKTIEEVKAAYTRKELTYREAKEILRRDFGLE